LLRALYIVQKISSLEEYKGELLEERIAREKEWQRVSSQIENLNMKENIEEGDIEEINETITNIENDREERDSIIK